MNTKLNTEVAWSMILLVLIVAVVAILKFDQRSRLAAPSPSLILEAKEGTAGFLAETQRKENTLEHNFSLENYGIEEDFSMPEGIIGNDYGDGLIQFVVKERASKEGQIVYDGGIPLVGIRISDQCVGEDLTYLCQQFEQILLSNDARKWEIKKSPEGKVLSIKRINTFASQEDYFDDYYIKTGEKVIAIYYEKSPNPIWIVGEVNESELPTLPDANEEDKRMRDFMNALVAQANDKAK